MKFFAFALALAFVPLAACATLSDPPSASSTLLDEKAVIGLETAYTAAAKGAALAIRTNVVTDPAQIVRIGEINRHAYAALLRSRTAYAAGNSADYISALREAQAAITELIGAF